MLPHRPRSQMFRASGYKAEKSCPLRLGSVTEAGTKIEVTEVNVEVSRFMELTCVREACSYV